MNHLPDKCRTLLAGLPVRWAVCGGFALELFAGKPIRAHSDVDVCVFEHDRTQIISFLLEKGWHIHEFRGMGKVRRIHTPAASESGRNLMALREDCPLVQFYPCEEEGLQYHRFLHTGMTELNYIDLLFSRTEENRLIVPVRANISRELSSAILLQNGLPILAPEIALLHKSSAPDDPVCQLDFDSVYPLLTQEQKHWLHTSLTALYPQGHPWNRI